jgi:hypothetical protein
VAGWVISYLRRKLLNWHMNNPKVRRRAYLTGNTACAKALWWE